MATVNLDFETSIDLEEDEGIMLADFPRIFTRDGGKKVNIVVTNKRVAAIPYGKPNKAESWYYNKDLTEAKAGAWIVNGQPNPNSFGLISGRSEQLFYKFQNDIKVVWYDIGRGGKNNGRWHGFRVQ